MYYPSGAAAGYYDGYYDDYYGGYAQGGGAGYYEDPRRGGGGGQARQRGGARRGRRAGRRQGQQGGYGGYQGGGGYQRGGGGGGQQQQRQAADDGFDYGEDWKERIKKPPQDDRPKTSDVTDTKGSTFEEFELKKPLLRGILEFGFETPSPIQEAAIPCILQRRNVLARAKNGTGKTGAYVIPTLQQVDAGVGRIQALILVPTRELALQTSKVVKDLGKFLSVNVVCATGGTSLRDDIIRLRSQATPCHVLVGTPGRILDLVESNVARLMRCTMVTMDEADKLLSTDFVGLIERILGHVTHKGARLMLFSATFPASVRGFCDKWLKEHDQLNMMDELTLKGVTQYYAYVQEKQKVHCLLTLLNKLHIDQCIIFCRSMNRVELLARKLSKLGLSCFYTHAGMSQRDRSRVFHDFRENKSRFLVCTDLITRGVDIQSVNVVVNFDFPKTDETYLHRVGRGGRFGHLALGINFVTPDDRQDLYNLEKALGTEIAPIPEDVELKLYATDAQTQ